MPEETKYINEGNPVYISYSWATDGYPDLEDEVDALCELMKENHIDYKRDKDQDPDHRLINYRNDIKKSEEEIGKGNAIIVVLSEKYLKSPHCWYELHCIMQQGNDEDFKKRVFPIVIPWSPELVIKDVVSLLACSIRIKKDNHKKTLSSVEEFMIDKCDGINHNYEADVEKLEKYLLDTVTKYYIKDKSDYSQVLVQLKKHLSSVEHKDDLNIPRSDKNLKFEELKAIFYSKLFSQIQLVHFFNSINTYPRINFVSSRIFCTFM